MVGESELKDGAEPLYSVESYRPEEGIGLLLGMVRSQLMAALDDELADLGLTGAQLPVLFWIGQTPDATAATLCRAIGMDTGSMTRMLDRLEEKGFIRRVRSQSDRRVVHLELTAAGKALRPMITPRVVKVLNRLLTGFTRGDLDTLKDLLRRMLANA
ncbi:MAG: MarR family transcriptional regulator [Rhodocyclaceae bacterium]|nr:MarR family transcriptional regulator [Rhodocyclaceae bacterium]